MAAITIKNVPARLHERLRKSAATNRRSLNSEAIVCLESALATEEPINEKELMERIRRRRDSMTGVWLTDEFLRKAKNLGRP